VTGGRQDASRALPVRPAASSPSARAVAEPNGVLDLEHQLGCASSVAAVLERLGAAPKGVAIDSQDRAAVSGMLIVVRHLDEAEPEATADAVS